MAEHELDVGKVLTEKVDFLLVNPSYNVQIEQNDSYAAYHVFGLNDMKDMAEVLGDVLKPGYGGHGRGFGRRVEARGTCFAPLYSSLLLHDSRFGIKRSPRQCQSRVRRGRV